jgi:hypothetical protein
LSTISAARRNISVRSIGHEAPRFDLVSLGSDCRQSRDECKGVDANPVANDEWVTCDIQRVHSILESLDGGRDILHAPYCNAEGNQAGQGLASLPLDLAADVTGSTTTPERTCGEPMTSNDATSHYFSKCARQLALS